MGVRLLGHLLGGASLWSGVQTEIIEIPLPERPAAVACCPISGDLLVACENTLVLFTLRIQNQQSLVRVQLLSSSSLKELNYVVLMQHFFVWEIHQIQSQQILQNAWPTSRRTPSQGSLIVSYKHKHISGL